MFNNKIIPETGKATAIMLILSVSFILLTGHNLGPKKLRVQKIEVYRTVKKKLSKNICKKNWIIKKVKCCMDKRHLDSCAKLKMVLDVYLLKFSTGI